MMRSVFQDLSVLLLCHPKHQAFLLEFAKRLFHLGSRTHFPFTENERKWQGAKSGASVGKLKSSLKSLALKLCHVGTLRYKKLGKRGFFFFFFTLGKSYMGQGRMVNATPLQNQVSISEEKG